MEGGRQLEVIIGSHQTNHWAGEGALRVRLLFPHLCAIFVLRTNWAGCSQVHDIFVNKQAQEQEQDL